jgi:subtilase family serine protease
MRALETRAEALVRAFACAKRSVQVGGESLVPNRAVQVAAILTLILLTGAARNTQAQTNSESRITAQVRNEDRVAVRNSAPALVQRSLDNGRIAGSQSLGRMLLLLAPTPKQEQDAAKLVAAQHDSSSPLFHKWLKPAQVGERFGISAVDAQKVQLWLQSQGLTVHEVSQSRRFVVFSGNVAQVEKAFSTQMHSYTLNSRSFIANSTDIQIPAALSPVVKGVVRLHSDPHATALKIGEKIKVEKKTGKIEGPYGLHFMGPADFAKIYDVQPLYDAGINGAGQTIAIVSRSSLEMPSFGVDGLQDIRDFRNVMGLPANDPEIIVNGDDPLALSYNDTIEALLDVTWAGAVAPMAHIVVVASQSNFNDGVDASAAYIVDHNLAPIMSTSFGSCERVLGPLQNAFYNALWQQAAAQGITAFVSAGDNGGAGCDDPGSGFFAENGVAVNGIASTPYNVAVGGTQFDDTSNPDAYWAVTSDPANLKSALSYIPEKVWNESSNDPFFTSLWAGSGGVSTIYAKPVWQTATGVPNDGMRDLPDISMASAIHTGYALCFLSSCSYPDYVDLYSVGGTSASSPAAAGIMALVLQKMGGQPQGLANYVFYKLAGTSGIYHDITAGDNKVPDPSGQYTVGYSASSG